MNHDDLAFSGETPWHGLGLQLHHPMTVDEAYSLAMSWRVREQSLYVANPDTKEPILVPGYKAIVRDNNQVLAVMNSTYQVLQNDQHAHFVKQLLGGQGRVESAGAFDSGRKVWMLCRWGEPIWASKEDLVDLYLLSFTSHDGTLAHTVLPISVRRLNQSCLEAGRHRQAGIRVRHTARMDDRVQQAKVLREALKHFEELKREVPKLVKAPVSKKQMQALVAELFPPTRRQEGGEMTGDSKHVSARTAEARSRLVHLFEHGHGQETCQGTAWAALQAVCEFTNHYRMTRVTGLAERDERGVREARLQSIWFGASRDLVAQARTWLHEAI